MCYYHLPSSLRSSLRTLVAFANWPVRIQNTLYISYVSCFGRILGQPLGFVSNIYKGWKLCFLFARIIHSNIKSNHTAVPTILFSSNLAAVTYGPLHYLTDCVIRNQRLIVQVTVTFCSKTSINFCGVNNFIKYFL